MLVVVVDDDAVQIGTEIKMLNIKVKVKLEKTLFLFLCKFSSLSAALISMNNAII